MRIAYVYDTQFPTTETDAEQVINTTTALCRQGAEVSLVTPRPLGGESQSTEKVLENYGLERPPGFEICEMRSINPSPRVLEKVSHSVRASLAEVVEKADVVYTRNIPSLTWFAEMKKEVAYETYRPWPKQYGMTKFLFKRVFSRPSVLGAFFHSSHAMESYEGLGLESERLRVVHNGYNPNYFSQRMDVAEAKSALGLDPARCSVVYAGRLVRAKGIGLVLDMARQMPEVDFVLVGAEGKDDVEAEARTLENVRIVGWQPPKSLPPYLYAGDALLIPPTLAPLTKTGNTVLPMKLFLYLAAGRPIFAPRAPDTAELLRHDKNAWLAPADDVDQATASLRTLLESEPLMNRLGAACLELSENLTWDARAAKILESLESWI